MKGHLRVSGIYKLRRPRSDYRAKQTHKTSPGKVCTEFSGRIWNNVTLSRKEAESRVNPFSTRGGKGLTIRRIL